MIEFVNLTRRPIRQKIFTMLYRRVALPKQFELSVVFAPPTLMKKLNKTYRGKNKAANVLSFLFEKNQGEIFVNSQEKDLHYFFVHGCLHLAGYDHKKKSDATLMEKREQSILTAFKNSYSKKLHI